MNNCYTQYYSENHPGLWVLLTDEQEESINQVNRFINECIMYCSNGRALKDTCYIHVIGYNGSVKRLMSGYLKDLSDNPVTIIREKKEIALNGQNIIVEMWRPIWCKKAADKGTSYLISALVSIKSFLKAWIDNNPHTPTPVVWNICSTDIENKGDSWELLNAINGIKELTCNDGHILYVNVSHSRKNDFLLRPLTDIVRASSFIPNSYLYRFRYMVKHDLNIEFREINAQTNMSFNSLYLRYLIIPIMGWVVSEPRYDSECAC